MNADEDEKQQEIQAQTAVRDNLPAEPSLPRRSLWPFARDLLETLILSVLLFSALNAVTTRIRVESISMQPTLYEGELVLVNKLAYRLGQPGYGDIIVFNQPRDPEQPYIKRVIGLPGDVVEVHSGLVWINGNALSEPYIQAAPQYEGQWAVPEDALFVLGDNRNNSSDSHVWGMVPEQDVIGKAEVIYWPVNAWKILQERGVYAAGKPSD